MSSSDGHLYYFGPWILCRRCNALPIVNETSGVWHHQLTVHSVRCTELLTGLLNLAEGSREVCLALAMSPRSDVASLACNGTRMLHSHARWIKNQASDGLPCRLLVRPTLPSERNRSDLVGGVQILVLHGVKAEAGVRALWRFVDRTILWSFLNAPWLTGICLMLKLVPACRQALAAIIVPGCRRSTCMTGCRARVQFSCR